MRQVVPSVLVLLGLGSALLSAGVPDPDGLVERLAADRAEERDEAARTLLALGDAARPALERAKDAPDREVRSRAAALLELLSDDLAQRRRVAEVQAVVAHLHRHPDQLDDAHVDAALRRLHPEAADQLARTTLRLGRRRLVPTELVQALARHTSRATREALLELVATEAAAPSAFLRAAREPGHTPGELDGAELERVGSRLDQLLDTETQASPSYRRAAVALFARVVADAEPSWFDRAARDPDSAVRREAIRVLALHRPSRRAHLLRELAQHDPADEVRAAALDALCRVVGRPQPEPAVRNAESSDVAVRAAAARLLGHDATPEAVATLHELERDPERRVRAAATRALRRLAR